MPMHMQAILNIIAKNDNHISINNIGKRNIKTTFSFGMATTSDVDELISEIITLISLWKLT